MAEHPPIGEPLDGFAMTWLPEGIGAQVSDFEYEWEDVGFRSRVFERGPDEAGAYRVDLNVKVLRGERLTDLAAVRAFLEEYHEEDAEKFEPTEFDHNGLPGYLSRRDAYWFVEPGLAVEASVDTERYSPEVLRRIACGVVKAESPA